MTASRIYTKEVKQYLTTAELPRANTVPAGETRIVAGESWVSDGITNASAPAGWRRSEDTKYFHRLQRWNSALANVLSNTSNATILCVGDSTTAGQTGHPPYPTPLANILNKKIETRGDSIIGDGSRQPISIVTSYDPRVVFGADWSDNQSFFNGVGGNIFKCAANATTKMEFNPGSNTFDTIDIYYLRFTSGGSFSVAVDGGAAIGGDVSTSGTSGYAKVTKTCALGTHNVQITPSASNAIFYIAGIVCYDSSKKCVNVITAGSGGAKASVIAGSAHGAFAGLELLKVIAPDLTILSCNINDATLANPTDPTIFQTEMQSIITAALISGSVLLMTSYPQISSLYNYSLTIDIVRKLAGINNLPLLDCSTLFTPEDMAAYGYYREDNIHPTKTGHAQQALMLASMLNI